MRILDVLLTLASLVSLVSLEGCGAPTAADVCDHQCSCSGQCVPELQAMCEHDVTQQQADAARAGCSDEFDDVLACEVSVACTAGAACEAENGAFSRCAVGPTPVGAGGASPAGGGNGGSTGSVVHSGGSGGHSGGSGGHSGGSGGHSTGGGGQSSGSSGDTPCQAGWEYWQHTCNGEPKTDWPGKCDAASACAMSTCVLGCDCRLFTGDATDAELQAYNDCFDDCGV